MEETKASYIEVITPSLLQGWGWLIWHPPKVSGTESSILNWSWLHSVSSRQGLHRLHPHWELLWRLHSPGEALVRWTGGLENDIRPAVLTDLTAMPLLLGSGGSFQALPNTSNVLGHDDRRESDSLNRAGVIFAGSLTKDVQFSLGTWHSPGRPQPLTLDQSGNRCLNHQLLTDDDLMLLVNVKWREAKWQVVANNSPFDVTSESF